MTASIKSPFKFLDAYTKDDREIFFGRDREIEELYRRSFESKILMVYGESGTGKSSLVLCGLANKFRDTDWLPLVIRRGENILESISAAVRSVALTKQEYEFFTTILFKKAIRSLYIDYYKPIFFIFDQFEELFIFGAKEEKHAFVKLIQALSESDIECRFIFIMREEYMASVSEFEKHIHGFLSNRMRIENMPQEFALQAIKGPCAVFDIDVEEGFAEKLVSKLSPDSPDVELTYLQVYLDKLWSLAVSSRESEKAPVRFSVDLLERVGDVSDLLGSFLDEQIAQMKDQDAALAILKSFVSVKGTKRQLSLQEVKDYAFTLGKTIDESLLLELVQNFVTLRILRDKDQNGRYELRHDALALKIFEKISLIEKEILEIRQFVENAYYSWQKRNILLTKDDLEYIAPYRRRLYLSPELVALVENSEKALEAKKRRRRRLAISIPSFIIIVLSIFTIWALIEKKTADRNANIARAGYYGILAKETAENDPTKAMRIAEYSMKLDSNDGIRKIMHSIYMNNSFYKTIHNIDQLLYNNAFALSPDGKTFLTATTDLIIKLWDLNGNLIRTFSGHKASITSVAFSPKGDFILSGDNSFTAFLWSINGEKIREFKGNEKNFPEQQWQNPVAFSPTGDTIVTSSGDPAVILWNKSGEILRIYPQPSLIRDVEFSPSGKLLAVVPVGPARVIQLNGDNVRIFSGLRGGAWSVTFSPDGKYLLAGGYGQDAIMFDMSGKIITEFLGHSGAIQNARFSRDGRFIYTGSVDNTIRMWNLNGELLQVFKGHSNNARYIDISPDGKWLLSYSWDKSVRMWKIDGTMEHIFKWNIGTIRSFSRLPEKKQALVVGSNDAWWWDMETNEARSIFKGLKLDLIEFSPDGKYIGTRTYDQTSVGLWNTDGDLLSETKSNFNWFKFLDDGKFVVYSGNPKFEINIFEKGLKIKNVKLKLGEILNLNVMDCLDDSTFFVGFGQTHNHIIKMINLNTGHIVKFEGHNDVVWSIAVTPDRKNLVSGSQDNTAIVWDMKGNPLIWLKGESGIIDGIKISSDGKTILTRVRGFGIRLWNLNGDNIMNITDPQATIRFASFYNNDKSILTVSQIGHVRIWDIKEPLSDFRSKGQFDELKISDKIQYGFISFDDVVNSKDSKVLYEAGRWFYENSGSADRNMKIRYLDFSVRLLERATNIEKNAEYIIQLERAYASRESLTPDDETWKNNYAKLESLSLGVVNETDKAVLINRFWTLGQTTPETERRIEYYKLVLKLKEGLRLTEAYDYSITYDSLAMVYVKTGLYAEAISTSLLGIEYSSNDEFLYATLSLAYICNKQTDEAMKIIKEHKGRSKGQWKFSDYVLSELKKKEISLSDFEKVRQELEE